MRTAPLLALLIALSVAPGRADDFKTTDGQELKGVTVSRVEPDGLVVMTDSGVAKLPFAKLPADVQKKYGYNAAAAADFANKLRAEQARRDTAAKATQNAQQTAAADAAKPIVRLRGVVTQVIKGGVVVKCVEPRTPVSAMGRLGGAFGHTLPSTADDRPEEVYGEFIIAAHPKINQLAEGDQIDVDAAEDGLGSYTEAFSGATRTFHRYKVRKDFGK